MLTWDHTETIDYSDCQDTFAGLMNAIFMDTMTATKTQFPTYRILESIFRQHLTQNVGAIVNIEAQFVLTFNQPTR
jgi:hypothetical protein